MLISMVLRRPHYNNLLLAFVNKCFCIITNSMMHRLIFKNRRVSSANYYAERMQMAEFIMYCFLSNNTSQEQEALIRNV